MIPLAEKMRPKSLSEWVGHEELLGTESPLGRAFRDDDFFSFILYAPPGTGKTTLSRLVKSTTKKNRVIFLNAVSSGVKDVKDVIEGAGLWQRSQDQGTILMIDEIHRFNKSQQDVLLAAVEKGDIILIGATTENPSYELNAALLSRVKVFRMESLTSEDVLKILNRAVEAIRVDFSDRLQIEDQALELIAKSVTGDARSALNILESILPSVTILRVRKALEQKPLQHDKTGDLHHQIVSAFIKSMRASQVDAALYYMARLWEAGEDPTYIARRMLIFASEDIGNADIRALAIANAVRQACEFVGRPECYYALSQGVIFLAKAPKSREVGELFQRALQKVQQTGHKPPPKFLMNANTKLDRDLGRGRPREGDESFMPSEAHEEN